MYVSNFDLKFLGVILICVLNMHDFFQIFWQCLNLDLGRMSHGTCKRCMSPDLYPTTAISSLIYCVKPPQRSSPPYKQPQRPSLVSIGSASLFFVHIHLIHCHGVHISDTDQKGKGKGKG